VRAPRKIAWWFAAAGVAVAALVRVLAFGNGWVAHEDARLLWWIGVHSDSAAYALATAITAAFDPAPFFILVLLVVWVAVAGGRPGAGAAGFATIAAACLTTQALKQVLAAPRTVAHLPPDAWPSGHATAAAALVAALLIATPPGRRRPVAIGGGVLVLAVCLSLVLRGVHFPSDVVGGACVAGAWGAIGLSLESRVRSRAAGRPVRS
jgi:membrane-associated phospholipid phosphatase